MYRAGLESILGLRRRGPTFEMDPCIPSSWPDYRIVWRFGRTRYEITVVNPERRCRGIAEAELDGASVDPRSIPLADDGGTHQLRLVLGDRKRPVAPMAASGVIEGSPSMGITFELPVLWRAGQRRRSETT